MGMTVASLRRMTTADVAAVAEIERQSFAEPWHPSVFFEELAAVGRIYLVSEAGGHVIGYGGVMVLDEEAHVMTLAVAPQHRRRGDGTRLLLALVESALEAGAVSLTLEVRASNEAALGLYRRFGFEPVGVRSSYYRDEDAVIMWVTEADTAEYRVRLDRLREGIT